MLLGENDIRELLQLLAHRLHDAGVTAGIRVVGGAAIALMNDARHATLDIDAVLLPLETIRPYIDEIAQERHLQSNWINDAAKAYVPLVGEGDWNELFRVGDVIVSVGSLEMLLAMKLYANRGRRDAADIEFLLSACEITSLEHVQEMYEQYHAQDVVSEAAAVRVQAWLARQG